MKRLYVHDDVYDDVCQAVTAFAQNIPVGDGLDEKNVLGRFKIRCSSQRCRA